MSVFQDCLFLNTWPHFANKYIKFKHHATCSAESQDNYIDEEGGKKDGGDGRTNKGGKSAYDAWVESSNNTSV